MLFRSRLDPSKGGLGVSAGTVYVNFDFFGMNYITGHYESGTMRAFIRSKAGQTKVTGTTPATTFGGTDEFTIQFSVVGSLSPQSATISMDGGTTKQEFVAQILAANIPNVSAQIEVSGAISIIHAAGGWIELIDNSGTAVADAGFTSSTPGARLAPNGSIVLSNFTPLSYIPDSAQPYNPPDDGTLW